MTEAEVNAQQVRRWEAARLLPTGCMIALSPEERRLMLSEQDVEALIAWERRYGGANAEADIRAARAALVPEVSSGE
jgi:DNA-binding PucR family transcriptional regulator